MKNINVIHQNNLKTGGAISQELMKVTLQRTGVDVLREISTDVQLLLRIRENIFLEY